MKIKRHTLFLLLLIMIGLYNCKNSIDSNNNKITNPELPTDNEPNNDTNRLVKNDIENTTPDKSTLNDWINNLKSRELPFYDSTNFDNFSDYEPLKTDWIKFLKLEQIYPYDLKSVNKIWIKEKLDICDNFISLIFGFYPNDNELIATLVTYSNDFQLIDFERIAYDEIAESCMRTESYLDKNTIIKFDTDFCYRQTTDTIEYEIKNNGQITASR